MAKWDLNDIGMKKGLLQLALVLGAPIVAVSASSIIFYLGGKPQDDFFLVILMLTMAICILSWLVISLLLPIAIHESGHLAIAKICKLPIKYFDVFGFRSYQLGDQRRVGKVSPRQYLGLVATGSQTISIRQLRMLYLAGPLANLLTGPAFLWISRHNNVYLHFFIFPAYISFYLAIVNLLPVQGRTDGAKILQSFQNPSVSLDEFRLGYFSVHQITRPFKWNVDEVVGGSTDLFQCLKSLWIYWKEMDAGRIGLARKHLERSLQLAFAEEISLPIKLTVAEAALQHFYRYGSSEGEIQMAMNLVPQNYSKKILALPTIAGSMAWHQGDRAKAKQQWKIAKERNLNLVVEPYMKVHVTEWFQRLEMDDLVFESERLHVRFWRSEDVQDIASIYSKPIVVENLGPSYRPARSESELREELTNRIAVQKTWAPGTGVWAVIRKEDGALIGSASCDRISANDGGKEGEYEIAWHLDNSVWGQGYGSELAAELVHFALRSNPNATKLVALVVPGNDASAKICRKMGMTSKGVLRQYYDAELEVFTIERPPLAWNEM